MKTRNTLSAKLHSFAVGAIAVGFCSLFAPDAARAEVRISPQTLASDPEIVEWWQESGILEDMSAWMERVSMLMCGSVEPVRDKPYYLSLSHAGLAGTGGNHTTICHEWAMSRIASGNTRDVFGCFTHELVHGVQSMVGDWLYENGGGRSVNLGYTAVFHFPGDLVVATNHLTEGIADWVRYFTYEPFRYAIDIRHTDYGYKGRDFTDYTIGHQVFDYAVTKYGEDIVRRMCLWCNNPDNCERTDKYAYMWQEITPDHMSYDELRAERINAQMLYDPLFMWSYNGTKSGIRRHWNTTVSTSGVSTNFHNCSFWYPSYVEGTDRLGSNSDGRGCIYVDYDGGWTVATRGKFYPGGSDKTHIIFTLGLPSTSTSLVFALAASKSKIYASVLSGASRDALDNAVTPVAICDNSDAYRTIVATKSGKTISLYVDGSSAGSISLDNSACSGKKFRYSSSGYSCGIGNMPDGISSSSPLYANSGWREADCGDATYGYRYQDVRAYMRALSAAERQMYFAAFPPGYAPLKATVARWSGEKGDGNLSDAANWTCKNSNEEEVFTTPDSDTDVVVQGPGTFSLPSAFACRSFTLANLRGLSADADWTGLGREVALYTNAVVYTTGRRLAMASARGHSLSLHGHLAFSSLTLSGDLFLGNGAVLELPSADSSALRLAGALRLSSSGVYAVSVGGTQLSNGTHTLFTAQGGIPDDLSRMRMAGQTGRKSFAFVKDGNALKVVVADDTSACVWTGAAGDGRFSTAANWLGGARPTAGGAEAIEFAAESAASVTNDIGVLSPQRIRFRAGCAGLSVRGAGFSLGSGATVENESATRQEFECAVSFADAIAATGDVAFPGGVTGATLEVAGGGNTFGALTFAAGSTLKVGELHAGTAAATATSVTLPADGTVTLAFGVTPAAGATYTILTQTGDGTFSAEDLGKIAPPSGYTLALSADAKSVVLYRPSDHAFSAGDRYGAGDCGALTQAQADWLNSLDDYGNLKGRLASAKPEGLERAHLLNLDIRNGGAVGGIAATGIASLAADGEEAVDLDVTLSRTGALASESAGGRTPINGVLRIYATSSLEDPGSFAPCASDEVTIPDERFSLGDTVRCRIRTTGAPKRFFRAVIVDPAAQ